MKTFVAAVDCGTTAIKAAILDLNGNIRGIGSSFFPCRISNSGRLESDPALLTGTAFSCLKKAVRNSRINPVNIESISVTNQRATVIGTDSRGNAVTNAISWQDMGGSDQITALRSKIRDKRYYSITGLPNNPVFTLGKILCLKRNSPSLFRKIRRFALVHDYVLRQLGCDDFFCDWANASLTGMLDVSKLKWSKEILDLTGINEEQLPELVAPGRVVGRLSSRAASKTGLHEGTILVSGGGDHQCAGLGAGVVKPGILEINLGTAAVPVCFSAKVLLDPLMRVTCCAHAVPGKWELEGLQNCAGAGIKWIQKILLGDKWFPMRSLDPVADIEPGAGGVLFMPYLDGASAPNWNPQAKGMFSGLTHRHGRHHLVRAVMEGIAMETRQIIDVFKSLGLPVKDIRLTGGYTKINIWDQIYADILGQPVSVMNQLQSSLVGAGILAATATGKFTSAEEAAGKMSRTAAIFRPKEQNRKKYEYIYAKYCKTSSKCISI